MSTVSTFFRRFALVIIGILGCIAARAQQNWYLFIQSESSQAFYVRIGETIYASSPVGHLVINGLHDSTYRLAIGFPQSQVREQQFSVDVAKKDHGFELKKNEGRSWVLYNWLTGETIHSPRSDSLLYGERKKDDGFASLMAAVVQDSAVLYASVVKTEPPKKTEKVSEAAAIDSVATAKSGQENVPAKSQKDSAAVEPSVAAMKTNDSALANLVSASPVITPKDSSLNEQAVRELTDSVVQASTVKDSHAVVSSSQKVLSENNPPVAKLEERTVNDEKKLVFLDAAAGAKKDTITVIIPLEKDSSLVEEKTASRTEPVKDSAREEKAMAKQEIEKETDKTNSDALVAKRETGEAETKKPKALMDSVAVMNKPENAVAKSVEENNVDSPALAAAKEPEPAKSSGLVMMNSDCSKFASDNDVDKLRIKMMNERDAGNRIFIAHKIFKNMCFSTKQIKALSELFPDDELRFRFFETAWPFVSDTSNFKTLEEMLTDQFFVTRFRTLLRRQ